MSARTFLDGRVTLHGGDCRSVLATLPEASVDSVVCDPPYHLTNRTPDVKWCKACQRVLGGSDGKPSVCPKCGGQLEYQRSQGGRGFMGKAWDGGDIAFQAETWAAVLRVLKPGGHLVAFSGTRTYHRMVCAIEDAGFEIRDQLAWCYGSGFPKSHDVSKAIDRALGAKRDRVRPRSVIAHQRNIGNHRPWMDDPDHMTDSDIPATAAAAAGWGTALKPAWEPIVLARKPLIGTVAENVLRHGTGALNIDGCRVGVERTRRLNRAEMGYRGGNLASEYRTGSESGRWPANLVHDGSPEVVQAFPAEAGAQRPVTGEEASTPAVNVYGDYGRVTGTFHGDSGSAARFFYTAKADDGDRLGSKHPTVKPLDLMQWLVRLVTPRGGVVLDPFAGTGTTGEAAWREGMRAILIEREAEYIADIERRMELAAKPTKRAAVAKTKNKLLAANDLPLFAG